MSAVGFSTCFGVTSGHISAVRRPLLGFARMTRNFFLCVFSSSCLLCAPFGSVALSIGLRIPEDRESSRATRFPPLGWIELHLSPRSDQLYGGGFLVVAEEREGARAEFVPLSLFLACSCNQVSPGPISLDESFREAFDRDGPGQAGVTQVGVISPLQLSLTSEENQSFR